MIAVSPIETRIYDIINDEAEALGFEIIRVRVLGSRNARLQIMAERANGGMDVEDCADLSRHLSPILDVEDPIQGEYTLEISSPGIDRPLTRLKDFQDWQGHEARLELRWPSESGRKKFKGLIENVDKDTGDITLNCDDLGTHAFNFDNLNKAGLVLTDALIEASSKLNTSQLSGDENGPIGEGQFIDEDENMTFETAGDAQ